MILVTGATGNVGGELVAQLAEAGRAVRALVRRTDAGNALPRGAEAVAGDLNDPKSLRPALDGVRGVFLLPGYADMPGTLAELRAAGVEHVVLLSSIAAPDGDLDNAISRFMILSEEAVSGSGVPWTILRPSGFMSNTFRWNGQLAAGDVVRDAFGGVAVANVDPYDIAAVAARVLLDKDHFGRAHALSGPEALLPADRVRRLGRVLGRPLRFVGLSDEEARREMEGTMPQEYIDAFFRYYADGTLDDSVVRPGVAEVLGRQPRTFDQWAEAHAGDFPVAVSA
ncbi:NAD(P)H-binding protein [Streptomyces phyllanthi]|uniref:NAD-dependent epimerase/dehydratase family protein n=1 Tax=Streptomyces phyllanthi TaxID=1803180 RepID=A0A5N8W1P0_9ACTN|nr:NAD(P)H-binding protein [Streptomyces phyllanthi]MPY41179.1 NAD-dependent epimerase/dehydratase family protein [Streptomyces phyllanthi]